MGEFFFVKLKVYILFNKTYLYDKNYQSEKNRFPYNK